MPLCCYCCYWDWKCFSNFTHIFTAINLLSIEKAKGVPPWLIAEVQLPSCLKHLTSANLRTGEIKVRWVCFRLRCLHINYNLTVDLWWFYCQEVSYSWCITGTTWADLEDDRVNPFLTSSAVALSLKMIERLKGMAGRSYILLRTYKVGCFSWSVGQYITASRGSQQDTHSQKFNVWWRGVHGYAFFGVFLQDLSSCLWTKGIQSPLYWAVFEDICLSLTWTAYLAITRSDTSEERVEARGQSRHLSVMILLWSNLWWIGVPESRGIPKWCPSLLLINLYIMK